MNIKQPELWEDGQYLLEWDPVDDTMYSEAARKAQASVSAFTSQEAP